MHSCSSLLCPARQAVSASPRRLARSLRSGCWSSLQRRSVEGHPPRGYTSVSCMYSQSLAVAMNAQTCSDAMLAAMTVFSVDKSIVDTLFRALTDARPATTADATEIAAGTIGTVFFDYEKLWDASTSVAEAYMRSKPVEVQPDAVELACTLKLSAGLPDLLPAQTAPAASVALFSPTPTATTESSKAGPASQPKSRQKGGKGVSLTAELWSGRASSSSGGGTGALFSAADAAALSVLGLTSAQEAHSSASAAAGSVCRFFVAGTCKKRDCPFSHDLSSTPCAFWTGGHGHNSTSGAGTATGQHYGGGGGCTNGDTCPFLHAAGTGKLSLVDIRNVAALLQCPVVPAPSHAVGSALPHADIHGTSLDADKEGSGASSGSASVVGIEDEEDDVSWALSTLLGRLDMECEGEGEGDPIGEEAFWGTTTAAVEQQLQLDDLSSFPSLPGQHPSKSQGSKAGVASTQSVAFKLAMSTLSDAFPSVSAHEIRRILVEQGGKAHAAAAYIRQTTGLTARPGATLLARLPSSSSSSSYANVRTGMTQDGYIARAIATALPTITTGGSVSSVYSEARAEAIALARARNTALDKATRAYLAGDGAAARQWSRQGRELDERMVAAQSQAAEDIFSARNSSQGLPSRITVDVPSASIVAMPVQVVDLHGLHPKEAVAMAQAVATNASCAWICFLTGARHHSSKLGKGGGSVHAAVAGMLNEQGWRVWDRLPTPGIAVVKVK